MSLSWLVVSNAGNGIGWLVDSVALARWSMGHGVWRWLSGYFCYRFCYRFVIVLCHVNSPHLWDTLTLGHDTLIYIYMYVYTHACIYVYIILSVIVFFFLIVLRWMDYTRYKKATCNTKSNWRGFFNFLWWFGGRHVIFMGVELWSSTPGF